MARSPELCSAVLRIFVRCVGNWYRRRAGKCGLRGNLKTGGVTVIQRFGSALALNVHFHTVMVDGVYRVDGAGEPRFFRVPVPSDQDVVAVASNVHRRVAELLADWDSDCNDAGNDNAMDAVAAASVQSMIATGPRRGCKVMRLGNDPHASIGRAFVTTGRRPGCSTVEKGLARWNDARCIHAGRIHGEAGSAGAAASCEFGPLSRGVCAGGRGPAA
jgi:Putative transposase